MTQRGEQVRAWKKIPPDKPYGTLDAMLRAEIGLRAQAVKRRITEAAARAQALNGKEVRGAKGGPVSTEESNRDVITVREGTGAGTSAEYLTRRIARDHPEIFERMKAGEYQSARAAALDAGIVKPTITIRVDPDAAARIIRKHFTPDQLQELVRLLAELHQFIVQTIQLGLVSDTRRCGVGSKAESKPYFLTSGTLLLCQLCELHRIGIVEGRGVSNDVVAGQPKDIGSANVRHVFRDFGRPDVTSVIENLDR